MPAADELHRTGSGTDENSHGTHAAAIIGARGNNDHGISGLCWKVTLLNVRILDAEAPATSTAVFANERPAGGRRR